MWRIDDKNKRKDKDSSVRYHKRWNEAPISSANGRDYDATAANSAASIAGHYSGTNKDVKQSLSDVCTPPKDQLHWVSAPAIRTRAIPQSLNSAQQLQRQRLISAVANWCDHISSLEHVTHSGPFHDLGAARLFEKLAYGLSLVRKDFHAGRKLLLNAGTEVSAILQSTDPTLVAELLDHLMWWRTQCADNRIFSQHASAITTFLTRTSYHDLGAAHPVTLLIDALVRERISSDLSDMLCKAIELSYTRNLTDERQATYQLYFRRTFGKILMTQRRYLDVETWFEWYSADRKSLSGTFSDDVWALCILT